MHMLAQLIRIECRYRYWLALRNYPDRPYNRENFTEMSCSGDLDYDGLNRYIADCT